MHSLTGPPVRVDHRGVNCKFGTNEVEPVLLQSFCHHYCPNHFYRCIPSRLLYQHVEQREHNHQVCNGHVVQQPPASIVRQYSIHVVFRNSIRRVARRASEEDAK
ncbi:hypothetical protein CDAR_563951 [Caerostris darwini]|uniref:Uncharacterized protein n=1 Tax=Caerostris darwini TaxID=1538125 RepID=A0AAV4UZF9_9ARAC|nr:hypothetical protein CDAR_563951 [Caerostris darwini]